MIITLPPFLLFGYWGSAPFPWLMILSSDYKDHAALIAHERCHQAQQRKDGWLTFWWRYLTSATHRQNYEVEAYRVWLRHAPQDRHLCARWLSNNYRLGITYKQAAALPPPRRDATIVARGKPRQNSRCHLAPYPCDRSTGLHSAPWQPTPIRQT